MFGHTTVGSLDSLASVQEWEGSFKNSTEQMFYTNSRVTLKPYAHLYSFRHYQCNYLAINVLTVLFILQPNQ